MSCLAPVGRSQGGERKLDLLGSARRFLRSLAGFGENFFLSAQVGFDDLGVIQGESQSIEHLGGTELGVALQNALDGRSTLEERSEPSHDDPRARDMGASAEHVPVHTDVWVRNEDDGKGQCSQARLFAVATTCSAVMLSSFMTVPPGAERPNRSMPSATPSSPT